MTSGNPERPCAADPLTWDEAQPMKPTGRLAPALMAVLCLMLVLAPLAAAPFARSAARVSVGLLDAADGPDETQSGPDEEQRVAKMPDLGVRKLPLLSPETEAEIGQTPDPEVVEAKIRQLADELGLSMSQLESAQAADWKQKTSSYSEALVAAIPAEAVASNEDELADLASLLAIAHGNWSWAPDPANAGGTSDVSTLAVQLGKRASDLFGGCSAKLNYAYLSALKIVPTDEEQRQLTESFLVAADVCGDDPTPLFGLGMMQLSWPQQGKCTRSPTTLLAEADLEQARLTFERLVERFPDSPTGWVGLSEVESSIAGNNDFFVARPFTARQAWQEAAKHLAEAQKRTADEQVSLLLAQASCEAGNCDDAALMVDDLSAEDKQRPRWAAIAGVVYYGAGRYEDVAALSAPNATYDDRSDFVSRELTPKADAHATWQRTIWGLNSVAVGFSSCGGPWGMDLGFLSNEAAPNLLPSTLSGLQADVKTLLAPDESLQKDCAASAERGIETYADLYKLQASCTSPVTLLRSLGETERAEGLARAWLSAAERARGDAYLAHDELGLTLLQKGEYEGAGAEFLAAARAMPPNSATGPNAVSSQKVWLRYGYALSKTGHAAEAEDIFVSVASSPEDWVAGSVNYPAELMAYYAELQLGELYMEQQRDDEALASLLAAEDAVAAAAEAFPGYPDKGAAANNAAQVAIRLGQTDLALEQAQAAVELDPASPIFLQTLADAERHAAGAAVPESGPPELGEADTACALEDTIAAHLAALAADDSSPMGWNNLGVVQAACGRTDEAVDSLRSAIRANPDYALAWFNYGSLLLVDGQWSDFMTAEGALGIAGSLDRSFRSQGPALRADDDIYDTGLDLSQGLPDDWELGEHERHSVVPITIALIVVTVARVALELLKDEASGRFAQIAMTGSMARFVRLALPPFVGVGLSTVLLVLLSPAESKERVVLIPVALAAALLPGMLRSLRAPRTPEKTPATAVIASALLAPFGVTLPPLSGAASKQKAIAAPIAIGALVLAAGFVAGFASVPLERATLMALVAVLTTTLLPLAPYDGSQLSGWPSRLATLAMAALTVLFVLNLL